MRSSLRARFKLLLLVWVCAVFTYWNTSKISKIHDDIKIPKGDYLGENEQRQKDKILEELFYHMTRQHPPPSNYRFNFNVSHRSQIPLTRDMPDIRSKHCKNIKYDIKSLPKVSVVTPFYNEELSMLLRHVHSLLRHSPRDLLREIILVDDMSSLPYLGSDLEKYLKILDPRIRLLRNRKREGLARTRNIGANAAKEEVLIFLDSHMEFNIGWLEPLLVKLADQTETVLQPHVIKLSSMEKGHVNPLMKSSFGWDLRLTMYEGHSLSRTESFPTPALVGCAIAVRRDFFYKNGAFDPHLELWGAEHFELSLRTWLCGGRVETVPCSKVGHLFRSPPYLKSTTAMETVSRNIFRVAETWMDDYKEYVFAALKGCCKSFLHLDFFAKKDGIHEQRKLRKTENCNNFTWLLQNVYPELKVPPKGAVFHGQVSNTNSKHALSVRGRHIVMTSNIPRRGVTYPQLEFTLDKHGNFMYDQNCLYLNNVKHTLELRQLCTYGHGEVWSMEPGNGGHIVLSKHNKRHCLAHVQSSTEEAGSVVLEECDKMKKRQNWRFTYMFDWVM